MAQRILALLISGLAIGCAGGDEGFMPAAESEPAPTPSDEAVLDSSCPTPVAYQRVYTYDRLVGVIRLDHAVHVTCAPEALAWTTFTSDPPRYEEGHAVGVSHCAWRCVDYACAAGQDVRVDFDLSDARVVAITHAPSAGCP